MKERKKKEKKYSIGIVAENYDVHEQTLRLYEREGLLSPSRSKKNTRYYTEQDLEKLKLILNLTRDMGVNLAGVQIIINMRQKMEEMQSEFIQFVEYLHKKISIVDVYSDKAETTNALIRVPPSQLIQVSNLSKIEIPKKTSSRRIKSKAEKIEKLSY